MKSLRIYGQILLTPFEMPKITKFLLFYLKNVILRQIGKMNRLTVDNRRLDLFFPLQIEFYGDIFFIYRAVENSREKGDESTVVYGL